MKLLEFIMVVIIIFILCITKIDPIEFHNLLNLLGWIIGFYMIYSYKCRTKTEWFSPYLIFTIFFVIFNYGQPLMWALGIHREYELGTNPLYWISKYTPSELDIVNTQWYICISMLIFHFGVIFMSRPPIPKKEKGSLWDISGNNVKLKMSKVCGCLLLLLTPIVIYIRLQEVIIAQIYGYGALYYGEYSTQTGYFQILYYFFFPSIVGYLIANNYSKKSRWISYSIFGFASILSLMSGDRGNWLYSLIILFWLHTKYVKISTKKYLLYGVCGLIGIVLLSALTAVRNEGLSVSSEDLIATFSSENSAIVSAFYEMGGTMGIITYFLHAGNDIYPYANTYLTAVLGAISSRALLLVGLEPVLIADWFSQEHLGLQNVGAGFSMLGEAFVNGGYIGGLFYMFLWGLLLGKLMQYAIDGAINISNPLKLFIAVASLNIFVGLPRGASYLLLKNFLYGIIVLVYIIRIVPLRKVKVFNKTN